MRPTSAPDICRISGLHLRNSHARCSSTARRHSRGRAGEQRRRPVRRMDPRRPRRRRAQGRTPGRRRRRAAMGPSFCRWPLVVPPRAQPRQARHHRRSQGRGRASLVAAALYRGGRRRGAEPAPGNRRQIWPRRGGAHRRERASGLLQSRRVRQSRTVERPSRLRSTDGRLSAAS